MQQRMVQGRGLGVVAIHVRLRVISLLIDNEVRGRKRPFLCRWKKCSEVESSISMQRFMSLLPTQESGEQSLRRTNI